MGLRGYLAKRLINTVILIVFVITLNFVIFELMPGVQGAINNLIGRATVRDPLAADKLLAQYNLCSGFDAEGNCIPKSIFERYAAYFYNMITFQFGISFQTGNEVLHDMISTGRLVNTVFLLGISTAVSLAIGVFLGVLVAARRGSLFDQGWVITSLVTFSLPTFWMGLLFIALFGRILGWFPAGGITPANWIITGPPPFFEQILVRMRYLFLPTLVLTLFFYGGNLLLTRATMMEALSEDYITTARAKALPERTVLFKHALKNASLPIVTNAALSFGFLLSGAIITETVFNWDGLGLWTWHAILWKDFPVMQAIFYIVALCVIAANLISDIAYGMLDTRIKYE